MDEHTVVATRRSLHAVAERLLAGPQYRASSEIRLQVTPGGFGQFVGPLHVEGTELVRDDGRVALRGTIADLAAAVDVEAGEPADLYTGHADLGPDEELTVDPDAPPLLLGWFARGDDALQRFAPQEAAILWPEHFDLGVTVDEVNYGVSPGDGGHSLPYAYVGPWTPRWARSGTRRSVRSAGGRAARRRRAGELLRRRQRRRPLSHRPSTRGSGGAPARRSRGWAPSTGTA